MLFTFSLAIYTNAVTELTPWSQWACFNSTVASRARMVQNCSDVEYIDPVTNMTATNRSCDNRTETDRRTGSSMIICDWQVLSTQNTPIHIMVYKSFYVLASYSKSILKSIYIKILLMYTIKLLIYTKHAYLYHSFYVLGIQNLIIYIKLLLIYTIKLLVYTKHLFIL